LLFSSYNLRSHSIGISGARDFAIRGRTRALCGEPGFSLATKILSDEIDGLDKGGDTRFVAESRKRVDSHTPPNVAALTGVAVILTGVVSLFLVSPSDEFTLDMLVAITLLFTLVSVGLAFRRRFTGFYEQVEAERWSPANVEVLKVRLVRHLLAAAVVFVLTGPLISGFGGRLWWTYRDAWATAIGLVIPVTAAILVASYLLTKILRIDREIRALGTRRAGRPD